MIERVHDLRRYCVYVREREAFSKVKEIFGRVATRERGRGSWGMVRGRGDGE